VKSKASPTKPKLVALLTSAFVNTKSSATLKSPKKEDRPSSRNTSSQSASPQVSPRSSKPKAKDSKRSPKRKAEPISKEKPDRSQATVTAPILDAALKEDLSLQSIATETATQAPVGSMLLRPEPVEGPNCDALLVAPKRSERARPRKRTPKTLAAAIEKDKAGFPEPEKTARSDFLLWRNEIF